MQIAYSINQIKLIEQHFININNKHSKILIKQAALALCKYITDKFKYIRSIDIVCGAGSNDKYAYLLSIYAYKKGIIPFIYYTEDPKNSLSIEIKNIALSYGIKMKKITNLNELILQGDIIIDALIGIDLNRTVGEFIKQIINKINNVKKFILSIDVPSGLDANIGSPRNIAVKANTTLTLIGIKRGLLTGYAKDYVGNLIYHNLNINPSCYNNIISNTHILDNNIIYKKISQRIKNSHKGLYGHVLIIGGDYGMGGAIFIAGKSALRVGAGLLSIATRKDHIGYINCALPESMCHKIINCEYDLIPLLKKASVIVVGPGLGKSTWSRKIFNLMLEYSKNINKIIDADALNLLSETFNYVDKIKNNKWILTPHPKEASRLLKISVNKVQFNRFKAAKKIQKIYGGIVILKGSGTIIRSQYNTAICCSGNSGMSSGGMGDVLSGVLGGLLAQNLNLIDAAYVGVQLHSHAADMAIKNIGERGLIASDLFYFLRKYINFNK